MNGTRSSASSSGIAHVFDSSSSETPKKRSLTHGQHLRTTPRLAALLLVLLLFAAWQVFTFHWKLDWVWSSFDEVSLEYSGVLATSKDRHYAGKRTKKHKRSSSASSSFYDADATESERFGKKGIKLFASGSSGGVQSLKTSKAKTRYNVRRPKYLEDLTRDEKFLHFNSSSVPIVARLKAKHPHMPFYVIPHDRWRRMDNTTCIQPSNQTSTILEEWHYRAPYALILGAQKAGSSALASYLYEHSQIVPTRKELHFLSERMDYYNNDFEGIDQVQARAHYVRHMRSAMNKSGIQDLSLHPKMHVLDATPTYLTKSDRVPYRTLCLCPWARLIVLLREPISRAYSQFNMDAVHVEKRTDDASEVEKLRMRLGLSFDEFIQRDYDTLIAVGVLLPETATDEEREKHYGSEQEFQAWSLYTKLGLQMPIGRSLYAIQVRHWIRAYETRNQPLRMLVIDSDDMKSKTEATFRRVLDFLDLPPELPQDFDERHKHAYNRIDPMSDATRAMLERIFKPYNAQLGELLGQEWQGKWKYSNEGGEQQSS